MQQDPRTGAAPGSVHPPPAPMPEPGPPQPEPEPEPV
jgi:hypothetical protein